jgi:hypothetical protein
MKTFKISGKNHMTDRQVGGDREIQQGCGSTFSQISGFLHDFLGQNEVIK